MRAGDRILVGPDNGLLLPAATLLGGAVEAVEIGASRHRLEPVSATFHGRDVFAPVAAALAAGAPLHDAGEPLHVATLAPLELPTGRIVAAGHAQAHVLDIDTFGNVDLDLDAPVLPELVRVNGQRAAVVRTFADVPVGELLIYTDSSGALALAVNRAPPPRSSTSNSTPTYGSSGRRDARLAAPAPSPDGLDERSRP